MSRVVPSELEGRAETPSTPSTTPAPTTNGDDSERTVKRMRSSHSRLYSL